MSFVRHVEQLDIVKKISSFLTMLQQQRQQRQLQQHQQQQQRKFDRSLFDNPYFIFLFISYFFFISFVLYIEKYKFSFCF
jgi:hypothetical protein